MSFQQSEAGPSSPRTPPATPPTKSGRRRSWFGLVVSPFASSTSSPSGPAGTGRRNSSAVDPQRIEGDVEMEMDDRNGSAAADMVASSTDSKNPRDLTSSDRASTGEERETEILTIDGKVETPALARKRKKKRSQGIGLDEENGETVRLEDLGLRRGSTQSTGTSRPSARQAFGLVAAEEGSLKEDVKSNNDAAKPANVLVASSTETETSLALAPPLPVLSKPPVPSPRSSSLSIPSIRIPSDKSTPPLPTERPLPALPPDSPAPATTAVQRSPPTDIVITPSSPRKLVRPPHARRASSSMSNLKTGRSRQGGPSGSLIPDTRSSSQDRRSVSRKSSLVGLGLPRSVRTGAGSGDMEDRDVGFSRPPPLPAKPQSVSSPHPSRSSSPAPKISFAEPAGDEKERGRSEVKTSKSEVREKEKVKRARSLSGIFARAASQPSPVPIPVSTGPSKAGSVAGSNTDAIPAQPVGGSEGDPTVERVEEQEQTGKMAGVLEWLGMRKTSKRRASEAKLITEREKPAEHERVGVGDAPPQITLDLDLEKAGEGSAEGEGVGGDDTLRPHHLIRPELHNATSSTTVIPTGTPRQGPSSGNPGSPSAAGDTPIPAAPIPILSIKPAASSIPSTATPTPSARPSPDLFQPDSYVSSPTSAHGESFFTPPGAPWLDGSEGSSSSLRSSPRSGTLRLPLSGSDQSESETEQITAGIAGTGVTGGTKHDGRHRSWSDAPHPSPHIVTTFRPNTGASDTSEPRPATHFAPAPSVINGTGSNRPKLGNRSHSGNSAIIEKMKGVFAKSASSRNRARSRSLLAPEQGHPLAGQVSAGAVDVDVDEFGGIMNGGGRDDKESGRSMDERRWTASQPPNASLLGLHSGGASSRVVLLDDTPQRSARTSISDVATGSGVGTGIGNEPGSSTLRSLTPASSTPSVSSTPQIESIRTLPTTTTSTSSSTGPLKSRGRASTVSFASSAPQASFLPPPPSSPNLFPTTPRRRPSAIQRFSSGLLGTSAPSSPKGSLFPLPPRSSGSTFSSTSGSGNGGYGDDTLSTGATSTSQIISPGASPRPSTGSFARSDVGVSGVGGSKVNTMPEEGETAREWLDRMIGLISRNEIAGVLASSGDELHLRALELYMCQFDFTHNALDVALRRLLMQMSLPKETQQIDRVIEAFANRYEACVPDLFGSRDNTYVLAFSMMMLHTDAFNKNNKNKMSKSDYVRNTRLDGVDPITLEAFYDNITYTSFVFIEDGDEFPGAGAGAAATPTPASIPAGSFVSPVQIPGKRSGSGTRSRSGSDAIQPSMGTPQTGSSSINTTPSTPFISASHSSIVTPRTAPPLSSTGKIDIYTLIASDRLLTLRVDIEHAIPPRSPFSCSGTLPYLDMDALQSAFVDAAILKVGGNSATGKRKAGLTKRVGGVTHVGVVNGLGSGKSNEGNADEAGEGEGEVALRVTKVGLLSRKDDASDSSTRKTSRKWRSWSVILTGSQLLFFKDPIWALTLQDQLRSASLTRDDKGQINLPRVTRFIPDEVFPLKDAVAVYDRKLTGQPHTFRFYLPHRSYLIQASDESGMNDWICLINYSAAFKSAGIRMRAGSSMKRDQAVLAGTAAAASLKRDVEAKEAGIGEARVGGVKKTFGSVLTSSPIAETSNSSGSGGLNLDFTRPVTPSGMTPSSITRQNEITETPPSILSRRSGEGSTGTPTPARSDKSTSTSPISGKNVLASMEGSEVAVAVKDEGEQLGEVFSAVKAELAAVKRPGTASSTGSASGSASASGSVRSKPGVRVRIPSSQAVRNTSIEVSIRDIEVRRRLAQTQLDGHLTQARNLAILTPFQRNTRDRIAAAVIPLAARIRADRLGIAKYAMWMAVLRYDLEREEREWRGNKEVAMRAAEESLGEKRAGGGVKWMEDGEGVAVVELTTRTKRSEENRKSEESAISLSEDGTSSAHRSTGNGVKEKTEEDEEVEILRDPTDVDLAGLRSSREKQNDNDQDNDSTPSSLGTTPQELPILIRPASDDALRELGASVHA